MESNPVSRAPGCVCRKLDLVTESPNVSGDDCSVMLVLTLNVSAKRTSRRRSSATVGPQTAMGGLNGSTRHSILKRKDGVFGNASRLFSRLYGIRENRALGSLAAGRVAESDWASVW